MVFNPPGDAGEAAVMFSVIQLLVASCRLFNQTNKVHVVTCTVLVWGQFDLVLASELCDPPPTQRGLCVFQHSCDAGVVCSGGCEREASSSVAACSCGFGGFSRILRPWAALLFLSSADESQLCTAAEAQVVLKFQLTSSTRDHRKFCRILL